MRNSIRISAILLASAASGLCQTRISLQTQSRNVDFSAADSTRSFKSGVTPPVNCAVGDTFFKTDAPAGQNYYGCTAPNSWTLQSGGSGFSGLSQNLTDLKVTAPSGTALSVASGVYGVDGSTFSLSPVSFTIRSYSVQTVGATNPATVTLTASVSGIVRNGDTVQISGVNGSGCGMFNQTFSVVVSGAAQLTLTNLNASGCSYSGGGTVAGTENGTAYVYGNGSGSVTLEVPASSGVIASCTGSCVVNQVVVPTMTANGIPLATVAISAGAWSSVTDKRSFMSTRQLSAGTGIAISSSGGGSSLSIDTALVPQLGGANIWTGNNDFSAASSLQLPPKRFYANFNAASCRAGVGLSELSLESTGAPLTACISGVGNTVVGILQFSDSATNAVQEHFFLPPDWTGAIGIQAVWRAAQTAGNVVWSAQMACAGPNESINLSLGAAATANAAANGTANAITVTAIDPIPAAGCSAGKEAFFRFYRDGAAASDSMSGNAELISLRVTYFRAL